MHFSVRLTLLHIAVYQISVESMQVLSPISPAYFARIDSKSRRGFLDNLRCAANPSNQNSQEDQFSSLVSWLQSGGGSVSCIEVTPNDPCGGGRGLIASADIEKGQELITVPQNMQVRTEQRGAGMIASLKFTNDSDPLRHLRLPPSAAAARLRWRRRLGPCAATGHRACAAGPLGRPPRPQAAQRARRRRQSPGKAPPFLAFVAVQAPHERRDPPGIVACGSMRGTGRRPAPLLSPPPRPRPAASVPSLRLTPRAPRRGDARLPADGLKSPAALARKRKR